MNKIEREIFIKCEPISHNQVQIHIYTYKSDKDKDEPIRELCRTSYLDVFISKPENICYTLTHICP